MIWTKEWMSFVIHLYFKLPFAGIIFFHDPHSICRIAYSTCLLLSILTNPYLPPPPECVTFHLPFWAYIVWSRQKSRCSPLVLAPLHPTVRIDPQHATAYMTESAVWRWTSWMNKATASLCSLWNIVPSFFFSAKLKFNERNHFEASHWLKLKSQSFWSPYGFLFLFFFFFFFSSRFFLFNQMTQRGKTSTWRGRKETETDQEKKSLMVHATGLWLISFCFPLMKN